MKALFRCDATAEIGFGHLSRCMALAEAMRLSDVACLFVGRFEDAAIRKLGAAGFEFVACADPVNTHGAQRELGALVAGQGAAFVVLDSYRADEAYLLDLAALECGLVVFDDFHALTAYPCDIVLNFTWKAASLGYRSGPVLLLGPGFFPAGRGLVGRRPESLARHRSGPVRHLLIAIGGSDPKRIAARLVGILRRRHVEICLRVIAANEDDLAIPIDDFASGSAMLPRQPDLSEQLVWADATITGGGLIKYESAFMAVPAAAISQNEGQAGETRALERAGLVFDLGLADERSDGEVADALDAFLGDAALRNGLAKRMRETFPADPTAQAARAILEAVRR